MRAPITEHEYHAAKKLHDDYWSQYARTYGRPTTKVKNLGISDEQYDVACKTVMRYEIADKGNVSSHELARFILQHADCPVVGLGTGQGSNECGDDDLKGMDFELYGTKKCLTLKFGWGPMTE